MHNTRTSIALICALFVFGGGFLAFTLFRHADVPLEESPSVENRALTAAYTIGLVGQGPTNALVFSGFKENFSLALAKHGKSVKYLELNLPATNANIDNLVEYLNSNKVGLVVTAQFHIETIHDRIKGVPIIVALPFDPIALGLAPESSEGWDRVVFSDSGAGTMSGERLRLFHELMPSAKKVLVLRGDPDLPGESSDGIPALYAEAKRDGITLTEKQFSDRAELNQFLLTFDFATIDAAYRYPGRLLSGNLDLFNLLSAKITKPFIVLNRFELENGGLISYGPDYERLGGNVAESARMILLHGIPPARIPIQNNRYFELGINEVVATHYGITIPPKLREVADILIDKNPQ